MLILVIKDKTWHNIILRGLVKMDFLGCHLRINIPLLNSWVIWHLKVLHQKWRHPGCGQNLDGREARLEIWGPGGGPLGKVWIRSYWWWQQGLNVRNLSPGVRLISHSARRWREPGWGGRAHRGSTDQVLPGVATLEWMDFRHSFKAHNITTIHLNMTNLVLVNPCLKHRFTQTFWVFPNSLWCICCGTIIF